MNLADETNPFPVRDPPALLPYPGPEGWNVRPASSSTAITGLFTLQEAARAGAASWEPIL